uniref:ORF1 n=1 Tax=uncultured densovirus TaxID=748192 RepID=A0A7M4CBH7_9VIRU|nr:ORF1 [uncultured densovirus]QUS52540.1 VP2 [Mute swan feces associated ambidensovirus 4]
MSFPVSPDGRWQWNGRHWKTVTPSWDSEQVSILNENNSSFFEDIPANPEEIEFSHFVGQEDTPLLEQIDGIIDAGGAIETGVAGGFTSSATAAAAPGITAIGTGIVGTVATVGTGILTGLLSGGGGSDDSSTEESTPDREEDHSDPIVSIPDHRFIGPGNDISDTVPVDEDDAIARDHDIDYSKAKTQKDIQRADDIAINRFSTDFVNTGNIHSAIGAAGIGLKRVVEAGIGVQYPANLPIDSTGT